MVVIFVVLVISVPTDGHGVFDNYLDIGEMEMNRTIAFEKGTTWTKELKEGVKIYGRENMPTGNEIFQCAFVGQPGYDSIEVKTGCVAAQLLNVEEKVSCSSVTFTYGITSKENADLCWIAETGMTCATSTLVEDSGSAIELFEALKGHKNTFADCVSEQFLRRLRTKRNDQWIMKVKTTVTNETSSDETNWEDTTAMTLDNDDENKEGSNREDKDSKGEEAVTMRNETARMLSMIGAAGSLLLFLQIIVLLMSIKLVKRQAFRDA